MIDTGHALVVLATCMAWAGINAALAPAPAHKVRSDNLVQNSN